uniref:Replication protein A subunit n=1 Tax=Fopius arisanus TaxID=64838 RepID=A0A0C9QFQ3_9HYME
MTFPSLTKGALLEIYKGNDVEKPICQVLGIKKLGNGDRYRLLISDGMYISPFTMLATQLNHIVDEGILAEYSIIEIVRYVLSQANNGGKPRRVMILLEVTQKAAGSDIGGKIGTPVPVEKHLTSDDGGTEQAASTSTNAAVKRPAPASSAPPEKKRLNDTINAGSHISTTPIAVLSPYQNRWVIKARVNNKSDVRTWSNARGEGKLFSIDLGDESGEIRCTGFREAVDKYFDMIEIGKVYYISRCSLKPANKAFNHLKNEYEMSMNNDTEIILCDDGADDIPAIHFNFEPISSIEHCPKGAIIDIVGVAKQINEPQNLVARTTGKELRKRDIRLIDQSNTMVTFTVWGSHVSKFDGLEHPVVAIKGARVDEFNGGKNLGTIPASLIQIDPDIIEAHSLRGWWAAGGNGEEAKLISKDGPSGMAGTWLKIKAALAKSKTLDTSGDVIYICKAAVSFVRSENAIYKACPTDSCNKKVIDSDGCFRCEKCDRDFPNFKYRFIAQVTV